MWIIETRGMGEPADFRGFYPGELVAAKPLHLGIPPSWQDQDNSGPNFLGQQEVLPSIARSVHL